MINKRRNAYFLHKPTGKTVWKINSTVQSDYIWNKLKAEVIQFLQREKFYNPSDLEAIDYEKEPNNKTIHENTN